MNHRNPPRVASWLLTRLSDCDEALAGDMIEEYRRGRSRLWYWRQTGIAVFRTTVADVRSHPLLALRAFVLMVVCVLCFQYCLLPLFDFLARSLTWKLNPLLLDNERPTHFSLAYLAALRVFAPCIGYTIGARIVTRFHRAHQFAFTLLNATLVLFVDALEVLIWAITHNLSHLKWIPFCVYYAALFLLFAVSTLVGGLWMERSQKASQA